MGTSAAAGSPWSCSFGPCAGGKGKAPTGLGSCRDRQASGHRRHASASHLTFARSQRVANSRNRYATDVCDKQRSQIIVLCAPTIPAAEANPPTLPLYATSPDVQPVSCVPSGQHADCHQAAAFRCPKLRSNHWQRKLPRDRLTAEGASAAVVRIVSSTFCPPSQTLPFRAGPTSQHHDPLDLFTTELAFPHKAQRVCVTTRSPGSRCAVAFASVSDDCRFR